MNHPLPILKLPIFIISDRWMHGYLSQFYPCPNGIWYKDHFCQHAEGHYQAHKILDGPRVDILSMDPRDAKAAGRHLVLRPDWNKVKVQIMSEIMACKFKQNQDLLDKLLATDNRPIYEDAPWDKYWGTGKKQSTGPGKNMAGQLLMAVRQAFREDDNG